ncbi:MAG TPA: ATP-grasp domain-containing protein [Burkholderiaceae bacterium]|nr:ATP-grasp domain-containing protein [Burkholderiaceae bacterium]
MRIHVFEFICGGGLAGRPLPAQLVREGDLMLAALIGDLVELPGVRVSFARDVRLAAPADARLRQARVCWRAPGLSPRRALAHEIAASDAIWPIAPESGGELERAARAVLEAGRVLLGPWPDAIALATSKSATARQLARAGIAVAPCLRPGAAWPPIDGPWVLKPDDGAGCVGVRIFGSRQEAENAAAAAPAENGQALIAQPWIDGDAMSLSVVSAPGRVDVLSVNRQQLRLHDGAVELVAIDVNCEPATAALAALARQVADAMPGLRGYFGIDWVRTPCGPLVIEVNPRLTSSYAGLKPALGLNVAQRVLADIAGGPVPPRRGHRDHQVRLTLNDDATG